MHTIHPHRRKDTVAVHAPYRPRVSVVRAESLAVYGVPRICNLQGHKSVSPKHLEMGGGARAHRVFSYREEQVALSVVLDLSDGPLVALQQDGFLPGTSQNL